MQYIYIWLSIIDATASTNAKKVENLGKTCVATCSSIKKCNACIKKCVVGLKKHEEKKKVLQFARKGLAALYLSAF
jgi:hypothetical protein